MNASHVSHLLFPLFQPVHRAHRRVARFFWGKPIGDAFLDFVLQVKLELFVQLLLDVAAAKEGAQAKRDGVQPMLWAHGISLGARCAQASSSLTTWEMAAERRLQLAASFSRCWRPSLVSE